MLFWIIGSTVAGMMLTFCIACHYDDKAPARPSKYPEGLPPDYRLEIKADKMYLYIPRRGDYFKAWLVEEGTDEIQVADEIRRFCWGHFIAQEKPRTVYELATGKEYEEEPPRVEPPVKLPSLAETSKVPSTENITKTFEKLYQYNVRHGGMSPTRDRRLPLDRV